MKSVLRVLIGIGVSLAAIVACVIAYKLLGLILSVISSSMPTLPTPYAPSAPASVPSKDVNWDWIIYIGLCVFLFLQIPKYLPNGKISSLVAYTAIGLIFVGLIRLGEYEVLKNLPNLGPYLGKISGVFPYLPEIGAIILGLFFYWIRPTEPGMLQKTITVLAISCLTGGGVWIIIWAGNLFIQHIIPLIERLWQAALGIPLTKKHEGWHYHIYGSLHDANEIS